MQCEKLFAFQTAFLKLPDQVADLVEKCFSCIFPQHPQVELMGKERDDSPSGLRVWTERLAGSNDSSL